MSVHSEGAQALVEEIRALRQKVPNVVVSASKAQRRSLVSAAAVPAEFVEQMVSVVENNPPLVRTDALTPEQVRDLMSYAEAYGPVANEVETLTRVIRDSVAAARNKAGSETLTMYALAQRLSKKPEHANLAPHVAALRRILGARFRKAKAKAEPPAPEQPKTEPPVTPTPKQ